MEGVARVGIRNALDVVGADKMRENPEMRKCEKNGKNKNEKMWR